MAGLLDKRLIIVSGKGGVGKSTVSAALALASARQGHRTLVCEVNATERISQLLGHPDAGPEVAFLEENLWAVNVRPQESLREYALMILKFKTVYKAVFENRVIRYFLRFLPSVQELVMLGKILYHVQEKRPDGSFRFDTVIMDAPATGHAISFLSVPQVLLNTVPPGALADQARRMRDLLVDPSQTAAVLVSLPEEMPVNETLDLAHGFRQNVRVTPVAAVLNAFVAPRFAPGDLSALPPPLQAWAKSHGERARTSLEASERLTQGLQLPLYTVPRLFKNAFNRQAVEEVASHLLGLLRGGP